jgi:hypothetical protein
VKRPECDRSNFCTTRAVVKASVADNSVEDLKVEERAGCISVGNLLDPELTYEFHNDDQNHGGVMATTPYPLNRYGHWHSDMEARGLYVPKSDIEDKKIVGKTTDGAFCYYVDELKIGFSSYWFTSWQPNHPKDIRSLCGSLTVVNKDNVSVWSNVLASQFNSVYICKAKVLTSEDDFREFNMQEIDVVIN